MPFVLVVLAWVPLLVSGTLLAASWMAAWTVGVGSVRTLAILSAWFCGAGYLQLFGASIPLATLGLVLQSILAVTLVVRAKLQS